MILTCFHMLSHVQPISTINKHDLVMGHHQRSRFQDIKCLLLFQGRCVAALAVVARNHGFHWINGNLPHIGTMFLDVSGDQSIESSINFRFSQAQIPNQAFKIREIDGNWCDVLYCLGAACIRMRLFDIFLTSTWSIGCDLIHLFTSPMFTWVTVRSLSEVET